eukprot:4366969-Prymnesium_polylepis.1
MEAAMAAAPEAAAQAVLTGRVRPAARLVATAAAREAAVAAWEATKAAVVGALDDPPGCAVGEWAVGVMAEVEVGEWAVEVMVAVVGSVVGS